MALGSPTRRRQISPRARQLYDELASTSLTQRVLRCYYLSPRGYSTVLPGMSTFVRVDPFPVGLGKFRGLMSPWLCLTDRLRFLTQTATPSQPPNFALCQHFLAFTRHFSPSPWRNHRFISKCYNNFDRPNNIGSPPPRYPQWLWIGGLRLSQLLGRWS